MVTHLAFLFALLVVENLAIQLTGFDSSWFEGFNKGESTYDIDGVPSPLAYWAPSVSKSVFTHVFGRPMAEPTKFYHESASDGASEAWQTHYPALSSGGEWDENDAGVWSEVYTVSATGLFSKHWAAHLTSDSLDGIFFDTSVDQLDGYGRPKSPTTNTFDTIRYSTSFVSPVNSSVNSSGNLSCTFAGCTARTTLNVEMDRPVKACFLSIGFRVTDFDTNDKDRPEMVQYITVNNRLVAANCTPLASKCNPAAQENSFFTCVNNLDVTNLQKFNGFDVAATITEAVDECPYDGALLSGVASVTCYYDSYSRTHNSNAQTHLHQEQELPLNQYEFNCAMLEEMAIDLNLTDALHVFKDVIGTERLAQIYSTDALAGLFRAFYVASTFPLRIPVKCDYPSAHGCIATTKVELPSIGFYLSQIQSLGLKLVLNNTDFNDLVEQALSIKIGAHMFQADRTPDSNPCIDQSHLFSSTLSQKELSKLVSRKETVSWNRSFTKTGVTECLLALSNDGIVLNVSKFVDDCPNNGHYVDAALEVSVVLKPASVSRALLADLLRDAGFLSPHFEELGIDGGLLSMRPSP